MSAPLRTRRATFLLILATTALSVSSGCETTTRVLDTAERAVTGRTGKTIIDIATSKDAEQALRRHVEGYARDPGALLKDLCAALDIDRKSTRLNSSHVAISYAVFCLKKKK